MAFSFLIHVGIPSFPLLHGNGPFLLSPPLPLPPPPPFTFLFPFLPCLIPCGFRVAVILTIPEVLEIGIGLLLQQLHVGVTYGPPQEHHRHHHHYLPPPPVPPPVPPLPPALVLPHFLLKRSFEPTPPVTRLRRLLLLLLLHLVVDSLECQELV